MMFFFLLATLLRKKEDLGLAVEVKELLRKSGLQRKKALQGHCIDFSDCLSC